MFGIDFASPAGSSVAVIFAGGVVAGLALYWLVISARRLYRRGKRKAATLIGGSSAAAVAVLIKQLME